MNNIDVNIPGNTPISIDIPSKSPINIGVENSPIQTDYPALSNKPQINGYTLIGNKLDTELDLQHIMDEITPQDIDKIVYGN